MLRATHPLFRARVHDTFTRIGGLSLQAPPTLALAQTDGSYYTHLRLSRTAVLLKGEAELTGARPRSLVRTYWTHQNSTESEWASVLDGLEFAMAKDEGAVAIENDNLGVVRAIQGRQPLVKNYSRWYRTEILKKVGLMDYVSIRWIPRGQNRADRLFRIEPPPGDPELH